MQIYYLHNINISIVHMLVILYPVLITIYNIEVWPSSCNYNVGRLLPDFMYWHSESIG